jgi:hypothetical protein
MARKGDVSRVVAVLALAAGVVVSCGGDVAPGGACDDDDDCSSGLECYAFRDGKRRICTHACRGYPDCVADFKVPACVFDGSPDDGNRVCVETSLR